MSEIDPTALQVGDALPELIDEPLTRTDFVRYQGASGDMNPIHHDEGYARRAGFPTVFAVGMLGAGILVPTSRSCSGRRTFANSRCSSENRHGRTMYSPTPAPSSRAARTSWISSWRPRDRPAAFTCAAGPPSLPDSRR
jgi:hypothetical protein